MLQWLRDLFQPECPHCAGESGGTDYFGEWWECQCCDPHGRNDTGRVWRWRLWRHNFDLWRLDRWIERQTMKQEELEAELDQRYGVSNNSRI
jgi:hypothetical protein